MDIRFCNQMHCMNTVGTYRCECRSGFESKNREEFGKRDEKYCSDVDECSNRNACPEKALCQNTPGSYTCKCITGYDGQLCLDVDECSGNQTNCDVNAVCVNTSG